MADEIGKLGLDTKAFDSALDGVSRRLANSMLNAEGLNRAVLGAAAAFSIWARNIIDATRRMDDLDKSISSVARTLGSSAFTSESGLEARLKEVNGLIEKLSGPTSLSDVIVQKITDRFKSPENRSDAVEQRGLDIALKKRAEIETQLAGKKSETNKILQLELEGQKEIAELEKNRLKYEEEIAESQKGTNVELTQQLQIEKELTDQKIKQKYAAEASKITSEIANDQAKAAIDNLLNEQHNARLIEDKAADDKEKKDRERAEKANQDQIDFQEQIAEENRKFDKEKEEGLKKEKELVKEILQENIRKTEEMRKQNELADLANRGNKSQADKQEARNEGARKINDALNRGSVDEAREYVKEMQREIDEANAADASKTPAERRAERASGRAYKRGINRGRNYVRDLDDRIKRGARGSKDSAIEQRREEVQRGEQFGPTPEEVKGGGQDSTTLSDLKTELKNILKQLTPKD